MHLLGDAGGLLHGSSEVEEAATERDRADREPGPSEGEAGDHVRQPVHAEHHPAASDPDRDRSCAAGEQGPRPGDRLPGLGWSARETAYLAHLIKVAGITFVLVSALMLTVGSLDPGTIGVGNPLDPELARLQTMAAPLITGFIAQNARIADKVMHWSSDAAAALLAPDWRVLPSPFNRDMMREITAAIGSHQAFMELALRRQREAAKAEA